MQTEMSTIHQVAELNNEGTSLLVHGDEKQSMWKFKQALAVMRADIQMSSNVIGGEGFVKLLSRPSIELSSVLLPEEACKDQVEQSYIYKRAIIIQPSSCISSGSSDDVDDERNIVCSAILFNLALLTQIRASRLIQSSSYDTNNALRMYEMCNDLLRNRAVTLTVPSRHSKLADMLTVACLNNMSQLLSDQGHCCKSRQILGVIQQLLVRQEVFNRSLLFDEIDIQGIMINALFMHLPATSAARAA